jgi:CO dehydrogenase maturation factor
MTPRATKTGATFALAGKGGVGKTTLAALMIKYLAENRQGSILAIDADPSSNLNLALGMELEWTVGDIREGLLDQVKNSLLAGLAESQRYDLIAMGRSEGPGCYCAVNHNLRQVLDAIGKNYRYVVIDNEAGMEHLSRRTTRDVDHLIIVSDPTQRGLVAARRIASFRKELDIHIQNTYLVINRLNGEVPAVLKEHIQAFDIPLLGVLPTDPELEELDVQGSPLVGLRHDNPFYLSIVKLMEKIL